MKTRLQALQTASILLLSISFLRAEGQTLVQYRISAQKEITSGQVTKCYSNIAEVSPSPALYIPNSFTPNGDGLNETFQIMGQGHKIHEFLIYNRDGKLVFSGSNGNYSWDGSFCGKICQEGAYLYIIEYEISGNFISQAVGSVNLLR